ncbi:MAG: hypothetical protein IT483_04330 [Gammaproteobacteria bacterium]|jgi:hypothetical protein|nr:hypothetical protein [Gammaproteobacteria bacterium]
MTARAPSDAVQRLTTVFVRQDHYAVEPIHTAGYPPADFTIWSIGDLAGIDPRRWLRAANDARAQ